jgi:hypothetical protein
MRKFGHQDHVNPSKTHQVMRQCTGDIPVMYWSCDCKSSYNKKELGLPRPFSDLGARFQSGSLPGPGSCSQPLPLPILWLSSPSPFFQHGWERCHNSKFLSLFGCRLSAYTNSDMATTDDVRARIPLCNHHLCGLLGRGTAAASQLLL